MLQSDSNLVVHVLASAIALFFLLWCIVGTAVGAGLIVIGAKAFRRFGKLDEYISTRYHLKDLSVVREVGQGVQRFRRLIGAGFILSAAYSLYGLLAGYDNAAIVASLKLGFQPLLVSWAVDSARWFLVLFSVFALIVGVMLVWFPDAFGRFESWANRWVSGRRLAQGVDRMYRPVDKLVETFPKSSGLLIAAASVYGGVNAVSIWLRFS